MIKSQLRWYVLRTKPHREKHVVEQLARRSIETYFPVLKAFRRYMRPGQRQIEPLFPGYVFTRADLIACYEEIRKLSGVHEVVRFGSYFPYLDAEVVAEFRRRETPEGYVRLRPPGILRAREPVRITDGLFAGRVGRFSHYLNGPERACVLLNFVYRLVPVELPVTQVRPAGVLVPAS